MGQFMHRLKTEGGNVCSGDGASFRASWRGLVGAHGLQLQSGKSSVVVHSREVLSVYSETSKLYAVLKRFDERLVLAESCTAGMVAAQLGGIPGVSDRFCGSLVVYRNDSKIRWLGIDPALLDDPTIGPVSSQVTEALARSALARTPEATIAGAITGHLGPGAPADLDGIVYVAIAFRDESIGTFCDRSLLTSPPPVDGYDTERRRTRQAEAAHHMISTLIKQIERKN